MLFFCFRRSPERYATAEELHRRAYNASFEHFGLTIDGAPVVWSVEYYDVLANTVGAMLENDGLFSLTQMLGDVSEGAAAAGAAPVAGAGPPNFAGMFGGPISEALGAIASRPKPNGGAVGAPGGKGPGKGAKGAPYLPPAPLAAEPAVARPNAAYYPHQAPQGEGAQGVEGVLAAEAAEGSRGAHAT